MISLALSLIVSAPFHADVKLADPTTSATTFELGIQRGAIAVQNAKTVKQPNGDVLYFVTNATGQDSDHDFANGPIAHLRTRDLPRGYAIVLTPRVETMMTVQGDKIIAAAKAAPTVVAPTASEIKRVETPKAESRSPTADDRTPKAESRSPTADNRAPKAESRTPTADNRTPIADDRSPAADHRTPIADGREPTTERRQPRAAATPIDDRNSSPMRNFGLLAGLLAIGAAAVVYGKKNKKKLASGETAGIDVIAVKALGGKQRLAVIDACGDRMLIATSEQGVQLLSKLEGGTGVHKIPADFLQTLAQAESASPVLTTHVTPVNTSKDLAGLVQLRARRATWTSSEPLA